MAFDEHLAQRVRAILANERGLTEKRMFGGLAFLVNGNMAVSASSKGGLLVRVEPSDTDQLLRRGHVRRFEMRERAMNGWLHVDVEGVRTKRQLESWTARGVGYARTLPPKR